MNENKSLNYETSRQYVESTISQTPLDPFAPADAGPAANGWETLSLGMVFIVWVALFVRRSSDQRKSRYHDTPHHCKQSIPCKNCRFMYRSFFLKCAIHPAKAMKQEAIGCSDYWAEDSDTFSQWPVFAAMKSQPIDRDCCEATIWYLVSHRSDRSTNRFIKALNDFRCFPTWMSRNTDILRFVSWLRITKMHCHLLSPLSNEG